MDFQRIILLTALFFTLFMIWQAWQEDYVRPKQAPVEVESALPAQDLPSAPVVDSAEPTMRDAPSVQAPAQSQQRIRVRTDVYDLEIDGVGGDLRRLDLPKYPVDLKAPEIPVRLMNDERNFFIAQAALLPAAGTNSPAPNHHQRFVATQDAYQLAEGEDRLEVRMSWQDDSGVEVDKIYTFHRGQYVIDVDFEVRNHSGQPWQGHVYRQLQRGESQDDSSLFIYTYTGAVIYSPEEKYEKISFKDIASRDLSRSVSGGWSAMIQHYFLGAWIPPQDEISNFYTKALDGNRYLIGMIGAPKTVEPGQSAHFASQLFAGPKLQDDMRAVAPGLHLTVDYGILTIISAPLFWLLKHIYALVGNWGWAIIFLTLLIKLVFYKLSETSYKSMAHMRKVQPKLKELKERYGDDKQKLNESMMRMYKEEKINPLGGCLPILVQIPVFIALYWMLLESVEMRQAPFMLWIQDLSSPDPWFILPILMGVTMLIQHRLNPTPLDPIQARIMMILPIAFTFFFIFFPAGLVLYWVVNNILSIAQQYYITRYVVKA
ncbi:MAG: membrane protein insertase YidC [Chromatiales bacterium]|nr:membrane protein insertase YidC [Gammaproteobacteria bacterium]MBW6475949.1 membrane protein insertase YidC [Chromatiales bacterium]